MKAIQVMMDERLLKRLDADPEVQRTGRSAVIRRAIANYLRRRRESRISDAYARAYGDADDGLGPQFSGWTEEGVWPER